MIRDNHRLDYLLGLALACLLLVVMGTLLHRLPPQRRRYPLPLAEEVEKD